MMRQCFLIGAVTIALGGAAGFWYFDVEQRLGTCVGYSVPPLHTNRVMPVVKDDGNAETCETIEPLVVEGCVPAPTVTTDPGPMTRVVLEPWMTQAPRPDAESSKVLRMPYADEDVMAPLTLNPLTRILETTPLSELKIFENVKENDPSEEAENKETPEPMPMLDYHHQYPYCPYHGGHCPAPYPYNPGR